MKISKYILASLIISALIAVPLSGVISDYQEQLNLQKLDNASLEIEIEKKETKEQKLEKKIKEIKQDKQKSEREKQQQIQELKRKLQAKRQRERRVAFTQSVQAQSEPEPEPTPAHSGSCASYRSLVAQYDWNVDTMMRIMKAESGCNPTNHNYQDNHGSCMGSYGLFQIGCVHGYSVSAMESPARNVEAAYNIWKSSGYNAWTTY